MGPDCTIRGGGQADLADMDGTGVQVGERVNKTGHQILDESSLGGSSGSRTTHDPALTLGSER